MTMKFIQKNTPLKIIKTEGYYSVSKLLILDKGCYVNHYETYLIRKYESSDKDYENREVDNQDPFQY